MLGFVCLFLVWSIHFLVICKCDIKLHLSPPQPQNHPCALALRIFSNHVINVVVNVVSCDADLLNKIKYYRNKYREGGDCLDIEDRCWVV